jgi:chromosome segregation ATPase
MYHVPPPLQLNTAQEDLAKSHAALDNQQSVNSQLKLDVKNLNQQLTKVTADLNETNSRLTSETTVASEMKHQLAELKMEYIAAGDKLEAEQGLIRKLQTDVKSMESALSTTSHDKKAAQMENAQLTSQLESSHKAVYMAQSSQEALAQELANSEVQTEELRGQVASLERECAATQAALQQREGVCCPSARCWCLECGHAGAAPGCMNLVCGVRA